MTVPTTSAFRLRFPEFSDVDSYPSEQVQFALDEAALFTSGAPDSKRTIANLYLAAHILSTAGLAADTGGLTLRHQSIGRISETYQDSRNSDADKSAIAADLQLTVYGKRYMRIMANSSPFATIGHRRKHGWWWGC